MLSPIRNGGVVRHNRRLLSLGEEGAGTNGRLCDADEEEENEDEAFSSMARHSLPNLEPIRMGQVRIEAFLNCTRVCSK